MSTEKVTYGITPARGGYDIFRICEEDYEPCSWLTYLGWAPTLYDAEDRCLSYQIADKPQ